MKRRWVAMTNLRCCIRWLELLKLKAKNGWSDKSFTDLLVLLKDMLPKANKLPCNTYRAKKLIAPLALDVQKIHAYPNHCILYRKKYEYYDRCPCARGADTGAMMIAKMTMIPSR